MPITVPAGVEVTIAENNVVTVKGPKGTLVQALRWAVLWLARQAQWAAASWPGR